MASKATTDKPVRRRQPVVVRHARASGYVDVKGRPLPAPGDEMETVTVMVSPAMAEDFKARPLPRFDDGRPMRNRKKSEGHVKTIVGWIERDEWMLSPEGFAFTPDGAMLEGWQRCEAIIRTGVTVPVRATFNCPTKVMKVLNLGKKRTPRDLAEMSGIEQYAPVFASAIKLLYVCLLNEAGSAEVSGDWTWWSRVPMSSTQQADAQEAHAGDVNGWIYDEGKRSPRAGLARRLADGYRMRRDAKAVDGAAATFLYLAERAWPGSVTRRTIRSGEGEDEQLIEEGPLITFRDQVIEGQGIWKGDPAFTLRRWLDVGHGSTWDARHRRQAHLAGLIVAWNAFARGEKLTEIRLAQRASGKILPMEALYTPGAGSDG